MPVSSVNSSMMVCGMYSDHPKRLSEPLLAPAGSAASRPAASSIAVPSRITYRMSPPAGSLGAAPERLGGEHGQHGRHDEHAGDGVEGRVEPFLHAPEDLERQRTRGRARREVRD